MKEYQWVALGFLIFMAIGVWWIGREDAKDDEWEAKKIYNELLRKVRDRAKKTEGG